jgi:large subunit ribosomal protein L2
MGVKKLKPITPGQRYMIVSDFDGVSKGKPEKSLTKGKHQSGGRNGHGKMTMRYRGGGHKRRYREIDFKRNKFGVPGIVNSIEYDPNRTARIALIFYKDGEKRYIIAPEGLAVGQEINSGKGISPDVGNALYLDDIPLGTVIHNIELSPNQGAKIARSAGSYAQLVAKDGKYVTIKLPSGEVRIILKRCLATIGSVSNSEHSLLIKGKAGKSRWLGRRPRTRGVAMNPVDHPMGGGEGKSSGGHPRSRKGLPAKGYKTRKKNKSSNRFIIERRKK